MRFKYLTAIMLRNAAADILNGDNQFMCVAIYELGGINAENEFRNLLTEMNVRTIGTLYYLISPDDNYYVKGFEGSVFDEDARFTRAFFLHMLADAIAYKAPKKIDYRWRDPFMEPPEVPGVYERDFGQIKEGDVPEFQYWDGVVWHYGNYSYTQTLKREFNVDSIAIGQDRNWRHVSPELKKT